VTHTATLESFERQFPNASKVADMQNPYWFFNTDESEIEGEGAYIEMLNRSVIAAWGDCNGNGAERTLNKPKDGDQIFYFLAGTGIIASGKVSGLAFQANTIFRQASEFHRTVVELIDRRRNPLTTKEVREVTGYHLPAKKIVCQMWHKGGVEHIARCFGNDTKKA